MKNVQKISTPTTSTGRTKKKNDKDYKKLFLYFPNFSNNKLLYIVILLLPFAKCFISVNKYLIRIAKTWQYSYFLTSKPSLLYLNLNKKPAVYRKHFRKIALLHLKIVSELRKNLRSFSHHINFIVFGTVWSKINLLSYSATFFFTDIYRIVNFERICL